MGMTMTTISNNLNTGNLLKTEAAGSLQATSANNTFSGILAMQAPASSQNRPSSTSSATQSTTENSNVTAQAASKEPVAPNNQASGKTENDSSYAENKASINDDAVQANKTAPNENTEDAENRITPENGLNAAQIPSEALPVNLLAEHAILQQDKSESSVNAGEKGKPSLENTLLSQLIEPQRNLANRLSGKNPVNAELQVQTPSGALAPFVKNRLAGSGKEKPDTLLNTENARLTASQLTALDQQTVAGRAVNLNANKEAADQILDILLGRPSQDPVTPNLADPRNLNLKTPAQPLANQAADMLLEATVATNANANTNPAVGTLAANTQAQAPVSPLISIGTSFYHPGWSQAMAQQLATQASLFFRQQANGTHIAQMRLDPPELGPIKVSISIQDGVAQAAFVASNAAVRQALENSLADLHQALQEKGLSLGQAHVGQQDRQDSFFMEDNNTLGTAGQTEGSAGILADAGGSATGPSRQHDGLINTFA